LAIDSDPPEASLPADFLFRHAREGGHPVSRGARYINERREVLDHPLSRMMTVVGCAIAKI